MKKLYYRTLLTIVVLACIMPLVIKGRDGRPLLQLSELKMPELALPGRAAVVGALAETPGQQAQPAGQQDSVTVYRWQDDQGVWHFSNTANSAGPSETLQVDINNNIVASSTDHADAEEPPPGGRAEALLSAPLPLLHAGEAIDEARNVETVLQQRYQRQERMLSR